MAGREEQDMRVRLEKEMDEYRKDLVHIAAVTLSKMDANRATKEYTESKLIEEIEKRLDIKINELREQLEKLKVTHTMQEGDSGRQIEQGAGAHGRGSELLEFLDSSILAKEAALECPVCYETARAPIYSCPSLHLMAT